ncbi:unnamed protein product [Ceratitis capitata]|uniref:(Mediterranean fruit fly) hypothetical protein n=1 Tax=Ceratitis capitata TaxID=7213 RepID=A0A811VKC2_CERCA|nr:unnamed protein product [Ceratitis capitata]
MDTSQAEAQRYINVALREINTGNYENASKLLRKAKELAPDSEADELQELLLKLNANATAAQEKAAAEASTSSGCGSTGGNGEFGGGGGGGGSVGGRSRQRRQNSHNNNNNNNNKTNNNNCSANNGNAYSKEQSDLVKRINKCKNFYQVLNVSRDATDSEIKRAYKRLALQLHPDKNQAPGAAEAFKLLANAVSVLTDERRRKEYDAAGANTLSMHDSGISLHAQHQHRHFNVNHFHAGHAFEATFGEDITAEELFNIFFGNFPQHPRNAHRRPYQPANQRQPQERNQQPSLAFGLILVLILISMLSSLFTTDPVYSLVQSR